MLCVSTAKAYFPDRQSCSTLCRQPSGCAHSVEVVAVYPSLGSYSVVGLFRWASPPFRRLLILPSIMYGVGKRVFQGSNQYFVDLHKTGTWFLCTTTSWLLTPPLIPTGRGQKRSLIGQLFYFCSFAQIQCIVFVQYSVLKSIPSPYTQWERSNFKSVSKIFCKKIAPAIKQTIN